MVACLVVASIFVRTTHLRDCLPALGVAAAAIVAGTARDLACDVWWRRRRERAGDRAWLADHRWGKGARHRPWERETHRGFGGRFVIALFATLLGAASLASQPGWISIACGIVLAAVAVHVVREVSRGTIEVRFLRVPFRPGEPAELSIGSLPGGPTLVDVVLTLRRIEERAASRWSWFRARAVTWSGAVVPDLPVGPDQYVLARFDVPADAGGTCLSSLTPSYWELVIDAREGARPFLDRFLIPVYEQPR